MFLQVWQDIRVALALVQQYWDTLVMEDANITDKQYIEATYIMAPAPSDSPLRSLDFTMALRSCMVNWFLASSVRTASGVLFTVLVQSRSKQYTHKIFYQKTCNVRTVSTSGITCI